MVDPGRAQSVPRLSIVIPAYNAVGQVEGLLMRLCALAEAAGDWEIILADDASPDGTALKIGQRFPQVKVVYSAVNQGFGLNVMLGAAQAAGEYLAVLNTDIELYGNPFPVLLDAIEQNKSAFAVMPLVFNYALNQVENLQRLYCRRGLCWHTELAVEKLWSERLRALFIGAREEHRELTSIAGDTLPVPAVLCGAAFVCRREAFLKMGGFSRHYRPFYWEDVDIGMRALRDGRLTLTVPQAMVLHRHSETIDRHHGERKLRHLRINQLRFMQAHRRMLSGEEGLEDIPEGLRPRPHELLRHERFWWALRALRELVRGDHAMASAYWAASRGHKV